MGCHINTQREKLKQNINRLITWHLYIAQKSYVNFGFLLNAFNDNLNTLRTDIIVTLITSVHNTYTNKIFRCFSLTV
jgi:hypothetical protein